MTDEELKEIIKAIEELEGIEGVTLILPADSANTIREKLAALKEKKDKEKLN